MTWWIISNIELTCGFAVVSHLALILYSVSIRSFLNAWPRNSFPLSYVIIVRWGYLHNHVFPNRFDIAAACLLLYCTISNHLIARSVIVEAFSMRGSSWPSILVLYGPIRSTANIYNGMASTSLSGSLKYPTFCFLFWWKILQTFM